ncbi:MAG: hypothetical protein AUG06_00320 [Actinobacteria bacterium 13_1_20CM_2_65_11]|nr:MAG: hypothetical protein AUG06_00320 [Actinobacteria bacterium 13_1_20CM_2_65_11]
MRIFISYRREDAAGQAGRLYDQLSSHFGSDKVFIDVAAIEPGADFVSVLEQAVAASDTVLVVIGPGWLNSQAADGTRRIDASDDYLRREINGALDHGCHVIPVLVRRARMPEPAELPSSIEKLGHRNAIEVSDARWHADVQALIGYLHTAITDTRPRGPGWWLHPSNWPALTFDWLFSGLAIVLVASGYFDAWINRNLPVKPWEHAPAQAAWLLISLCLAIAGTIRWFRFQRPDQVIPKGYVVSVVGCAVFAVGVLSSIWWSVLFGAETPGVPTIFRPSNLLQIAGGGLIVAGPLRAAVGRRELRAGPPALISATLLLGTITFFSQFDHPYVNPWAYDLHQLSKTYAFVGEELGALSLMMQAAITTGTILFVLRQIRLPPGSISFMLTITAIFVCTQLGHFQFIAVAAVVGVASDVLLFWAGQQPTRLTQLRVFATAMGVLLPLVYLLEVWLTEGTYWTADVVSGTVLACGIIGWLMTVLTFPDRETAKVASILWPPRK